MNIITWESGFKIKTKVKGSSISIKLSKGIYYILHRTKICKSKIKLKVESPTPDIYKTYLYVYIFSGKVIYSNAMMNTDLTMPLYLIEFDLTNGKIMDHKVTDMRGMIISKN